MPIDVSGEEVEDEFIPAQMFEEISAPEMEDQPIIGDAETTEPEDGIENDLGSTIVATPDAETNDDPAVDTTEPTEIEDPVAETEVTDELEPPLDLAEGAIDETPEEIPDEPEEPIDETPEEDTDEPEDPLDLTEDLPTESAVLGGIFHRRQ